MALQISIDPTPRFSLSPWLYMQFMEPLGTTDSSVEAAWDFVEQRWRPEFVQVVRELCPGAIRWGGIYTSFWKWREGVGPRDQRAPAHNLVWRGMETSQIGVHEILELCRLAGAEPIMGVNFGSDGRPGYIHPPVGPSRAGSADEAADLVSYCNDPDHPERRANGAPEPWNVRLWQLGNETSYPPPGQRFTSQENVAHFRAFAQTMRERDPSIQLIGWGGMERASGRFWAQDLLRGAGDLVDYVAMHMMNQNTSEPDTVLASRAYMRDRELAWHQLGGIYEKVASKLEAFADQVRASGAPAKIAITEGHLSLRPHNTNLLLYEWLAGLYYAREMTLYERHGDLVKIATMADFCGNRWTVNAVMMGSASQAVFLMPVATIMKLLKQYGGSQGLDVPAHTGSLELSASRSQAQLFLHVVNTDLHASEETSIQIGGAAEGSARVIEIAPGDLGAYVDHDHTDTFEPVERRAEVRQGMLTCRFPPASVSVVVIDLAG